VSAKKYIHFLKTKRVANENEKFPRKEKYLWKSTHKRFVVV
jgi:hypothetical protein